MMTSRPTTPTLVLRVLLALGLAFCPLLSSTAALPALSFAAPTEEEEERSEEKRGGAESESEEWSGFGHRQDSQPDQPSGRLLPPPLTHPLPGRHLPRAAAFDPFCNGLGSPYRC